MAIRSTTTPAKPLKLPSTMPDGKKTRMHPLLWCIKNKMPEGATKSDVARMMGVAPQSMYKWLGKCEGDRNFSLPAERVPQLAVYFAVHPSLFRPDLFAVGEAAA